jgi:putative peptidoglycan lipid II flippase
VASVASSAAKVGAATLLSRILGFLRDLIIARVFGADAATDAFFVAFRIPNLMRRLFAEGAFSAALVPILHEVRRERGQAALRHLVADASGTFGIALLAMTVLGVLAAPLLILAFAPGFGTDPDQHRLASDLLRLVLPYVLFIGLTALAGGVLNTYERFGVPAITPVLLNLSLIGCALWLAPRMQEPAVALAWGVLIAGVAQLLLQLPFLARLRLLPRPRFAPREPDVRRIARGMLPALFGISMAQLSLLLDTLLASFLITGSISWLYYSERLVEFPLGVLGATIGIAILPQLGGSRGESGAGSDRALFSATLDWGLRWVLLLGMPASLGLFVLAGPILATLFLSAEFDADDVVMAARSLMAYAPGLVAFMAIKVLVPAFYSRGDTQVPVRIAALALIVNLALSLSMMSPLGHTGLALATVLAALLNAGLLLHRLVRRGAYLPHTGWSALALKGLIASLMMAAALGHLSTPLDPWLTGGFGANTVRLLLLIAGGAVVYATALLAMGVRAHHLRVVRTDRL